MSKPSPARYRTTNWSSYNAALRKRGSLLIWLDKELTWLAPRDGSPGRPAVFSDAAIQFCLMIKVLFKLPLRQTTGMVASLLKMANLDWTVPDYSTLRRRQKTLAVQIPYRRADGPLNLLVDSTGIKFLGDDEWQARKHGIQGRRQWRKVHLTMDTATSDIRAVEFTASSDGDSPVLPDLLDQIPEGEEISTVTADGAYDSRIAAAGRSRLFIQGGKLRVVRDGAVALPVALYSMRNIRRGSFSVDYLLPSEATADSIEVSYFDAATWAPQRVTATLPGSGAAKPVKLDLFGVTGRAQALREGLYHAAANRYRRRIVRFATEMEGFIPSIGDLIAVQHDAPGWGVHAEAVAWDAGTRTLTLSEPMTFAAGAHYVGLRRRDGSLSGPWAVSAGATPEVVILAEAPDITPATGAEEERSHVVFGQATSWRTLAKVVSVRPRGLYEVEIEAATEYPSVHTADAGAVAPPINTSLLPRRMTAPVVGGLLARRIPGDAIRALLAWQPAPGADIYQIEMAEGADPSDPTVSWTRTADTTAAHYTIGLLYAARTMIRVRGLGLAAGPWAAATLGSLITEMWNTDATPMWTLDSNAMWSVS